MSLSNNTPTPVQITAQLDRILASEVFAGSQRLRDFLRYLVSEALGDGRPRLKELAIGMAVFGRNETFDPRIDSVVRVEAGRLRTKLREYYSEPGVADPVLITIPKGAYVPTFEVNRKATANEGTPGRRSAWHPWLAYGALGLAVALVALMLLIWPQTQPPAGAVDVPPHSIAVLPLNDWTGNPDDYFSEAMTDMLIAELSERRDLRVTALTSVMHYRNASLQPSQIAEELGVQSIVEGAVFRDSGQVRITASLIDAKTNRNLWSQTYNRPMTGVLALQEEVASAIATQLMGELLPPSGLSSIDIDPQAYEAFLKGTYWRNRLTAEGFNRGLLFLQQAIDLQPEYAEAYAAMASCHCRLAGHGIEVVKPDLALKEATRLATRALELNDTLAEPNAVLGIIKFKYDWDAEAARAHLERALEQNPSLFEAHLWLSQVAEGAGQQELAVEHARRAYAVNPLSHAAALNLGWQLYQAGQLADADRQFEAVLEFDPEFWGGHWGKGHVYRAEGQYEAAIAEFSRSVELEGGHTLPLAALGYTYAVSGKRAEALGVIDRLNTMSRSIYVSPMHIAEIFAGLDERDAAFEWLDRAFEVRARSMAWLTVRREFDGLRDDPRYAAMVEAVGVATFLPDAT